VLLQDALTRAQPEAGKSLRGIEVGRGVSQGLGPGVGRVGVGNVDDCGPILALGSDGESPAAVLADDMQRVDKHSLGLQKEFIIGNDKVRPRMPGADGNPNFKQSDTLYVYTQLYNFEPDMTPDANGVVKKADGTVTYEVLKNKPGAAPEPFAKMSEPVSDIIKRSKTGASEVVVEKQLDLKGFAPGQYILKFTAVDEKRNQTVTQSAPFTVN